MDSFEINCDFCGVEARVECLNSDHDPIFCCFCGEKISDLDTIDEPDPDYWDDD